MRKKELDKIINELTKLMREMALELNFEQATIYRDRINEIKKYAK